MIRALSVLSVLAIMALPVMAENMRVWTNHMIGPEGESYVAIHEPTVDHAVATVTFLNQEVHSGNAEFELTFGEITINVIMDFNVDPLGSERLNVEAPPGYVAVPRSIDVNEGQTDVIHIIEFLGG